MTPFGERLRALRATRGMTQAAMADALQVSAAYLSALEHGRRGRPTAGLVHQICDLFGLIWDDAEELSRLARMSHPRVVVDTAGLDAARTELANLLSREIGRLPDETIKAMLDALNAATPRRRVRVRAKS
jgi:transcriptional regulator with XRE-family HTH domain